MFFEASARPAHTHRRHGDLPPAPRDRQGQLLHVHVHEVPGGSCRYATLDTLSFEPEEIGLLEEYFLQFPLLMTGTSLAGDMDFEALWRITTGKTILSERWFFGRPWPREINHAI